MARCTPKAAEAAAATEILCRMVVQAEVAQRFGGNGIKPMASSTATDERRRDNTRSTDRVQ